MPVPTGSDVLDEVLDGGIPEQRTVLVTGGPGTGKSTLAMQFLQEGLEAGEDCLFVSTEQTLDELQASFADFQFDLAHDGLTVTSLHATPGQTLEDDGPELTLQTLDGGTMLGQGYSTPYESRYISQYLADHAPADRVVLDSVSGLSAMDASHDEYRRTVLDLIRLFNDEFGATALFTAEESVATTSVDGQRTIAASDAVQYNTHGVVRLWRENVGGDFHRYLEVVKMRGVDHDTRVYEIGFDRRGVRVSPRLRTHPNEFLGGDVLSTGIGGLDELLGGGVVLGGSMLLEHDGQASPHSLVTNLVGRAIDEDMAVVLVPPVELPPKRFEQVFADRIADMDELLADDRLFLVDFPNIWENTRRNVFKPTENGGTSPREVFRTIDDRRGDRPVFAAINVEAQLPVLENDELRQMRFWEEENFVGAADTSVYFFNPETMTDRLAAFYRNGAWQVVRTWIHDSGLQYIKLEKSPDGFVGTTRLVEYAEAEPHVRVQRPPQSDEPGWSA